LPAALTRILPKALPKHRLAWPRALYCGARAPNDDADLVAVTKEPAIEYATRGIRANAVSLGVIRTPMNSDDPGGALAALHPLGRMREVDGVVEAVIHLERASFVTGEILQVDGGQSAGF
jgi:NAD(P)-dependent dehydrogenase (short-subunit alcohol dehydrogenase family)